MERLALEGKIDPGTRDLRKSRRRCRRPSRHHETADRVGRGAQARPACNDHVIEGSAGIPSPTSAGWPGRPGDYALSPQRSRAGIADEVSRPDLVEAPNEFPGPTRHGVSYCRLAAQVDSVGPIPPLPD